MFSEPTVIVLGAGSSLEAGFPLGSKLMEDITRYVRLLVSAKDNWTQQEMEFLQLSTALGIKDVNRVANTILKALPFHDSIDNFLRAMEADPEVVKFGKAAIAFCILAAERFSACYAENGAMRDPETMIGSWYNKLFKLLSADMRRDHLSGLFDNLCVVNFNYDRSLKHFLYHAIRDAFSQDEDTAAEVVGGLNMLHPYGNLGPLLWEKKARALPYGAGNANVAEISKSIYTFSEDHSAIADLHTDVKMAIFNAKKIIFLGFAFHPQNMTLLTPPHPTHALEHTFSTVVGIGSADVSWLQRRLQTWKEAGALQTFEELGGCTKLFDTFRLSLA